MSGLDYAYSNRVNQRLRYPCMCGEPLICDFTETSWRVQHGRNPEHSIEGTRAGKLMRRADGSPYAPPDIEIITDFHPPRVLVRGAWIEAVHARMDRS